MKYFITTPVAYRRGPLEVRCDGWGTFYKSLRVFMRWTTRGLAQSTWRTGKFLGKCCGFDQISPGADFHSMGTRATHEFTGANVARSCSWLHVRLAFPRNLLKWQGRLSHWWRAWWFCECNSAVASCTQIITNHFSSVLSRCDSSRSFTGWQSLTMSLISLCPGGEWKRTKASWSKLQSVFKSEGFYLEC